jgi:hypothetical protein
VSGAVDDLQVTVAALREELATTKSELEILTGSNVGEKRRSTRISSEASEPSEEELLQTQLTNMRSLLENEKKQHRLTDVARRGALRSAEVEERRADELAKRVQAFQREAAKRAASTAMEVDGEGVAWDASFSAHRMRKLRAVEAVTNTLGSSCSWVLDNMTAVVQAVVRQAEGMTDNVILGMLGSERRRHLELCEDLARRIEGAYDHLRGRRSLNEQKAANVVLVAAAGGETSTRRLAAFLGASRKTVAAAAKRRSEIDHQGKVWFCS